MAKGNQPKLIDVANAAGVSTAAASLALRGLPGVSEATRQRVQKVAEELHYELNITARNLRIRATRTIGVYAPENTSSIAYYMSFIASLAQHAARAGYATLIIPVEADMRMVTAQVDGLVIIDATIGDANLDHLLACSKPLVSVEEVPSVFKNQPDAVIAFRHETAMTKLLNHLYEQGARNFAAICPPAETAWGSQLQAATIAFEAARDVTFQRLPVPFAVSPEDVLAHENKLHEDLDAIVCTSDGSLLEVLGLLRDQGRKIGEDILLASYIDNATHSIVRPAITALDHDVEESAEAALQLLLKMFQGEDDGIRPRSTPQVYEEREPRLIIRASTAGKLKPRH